MRPHTLSILMHSSLIAFLGSLAFVAFGYLSLLRLLSKQSLGQVSVKQYLNGITTSQFLSNLGSSAFFVSLPATSLLLFWGWGPALLWLLIFHLFVESIGQLQYSSQSTSQNGRGQSNSIADYLLRAENSKLAIVEQGLIQAFFLLSMSVVTALLATLIDRQSGLLFALLFLLPARTLLRHPSSALPLAARIFGALVLLAVGLAFSNQLGFSIYGDWAPLGETVSWLRFNNPTVIAAVLTVAVFRLEKDAGFKKDLSSFAGLIIVLLVIAMAAQMLLSQPGLDAPINHAQANDQGLPSFISISLIIFAGFSALLIRLLNEEESQVEPSKAKPLQAEPIQAEPIQAEPIQAEPGVEQFSRLQGGSFVHLIFMILLVLSLASALGIGAWKTHYVIWGESINILDHLNLAITSTLHLISTQTESGTLMNTILLAALCFAGFSFMLNCAVQLTVEESNTQNIYSLVVESKILQAIMIFVSASYFISNGISIDIWLIIGILGWILVAHLMLGMSLKQAKTGKQNSVFSLASGVLIVLGLLQTIIISLNWLAMAYYTYAASGLLLISIACLLWWRSVPQLIKNFTQKPSNDLF
ncbi:MAG: hypothetical protein ACI9SP_000192 [Arenicella sp.]|jgi:hypothetical protein